MFGSDYPHPEGLAEPKGFYKYAEGMDEKRARDFMGDNARRFLGLPIANPDPDAVKPPALTHAQTEPRQTYAPGLGSVPRLTWTTIPRNSGRTRSAGSTRCESGCPVAHSDHYDGFWAFVDYASVFEAARDDDLFNSYPSVGVPASGMPFPILPIESDPPDTQELRGSRSGSSPPVRPRRPEQIGLEMANEAIDAFIERGECDLVAELTTPLPARLILRLLKLDESRSMDWVDWVHTTVHERAHEPDRAAVAGMELFAEINKHMEQRRAEGLGDDLFSDILRGTLNGKPLDDIQITMYGFLMMLGGMDTTSGFTGNVLLRLCAGCRAAQTAGRRSEPDQERHRRAAAPVHSDTRAGPNRLPGCRVPRSAAVPGRPGDPDVGGGQPRPCRVRDPDTLDLSRARTPRSKWRSAWASTAALVRTTPR